MPDNNFHEREMQMMQIELQALQNQLTEVMEAIEKIEETRKTLESIKKSNLGESVMIPLGGGAFIEGTIKNGDSVMMNLGANAYAKKSSEEAIEILNGRTKLLKEAQDQIEKRAKEIESKITGF